ncbi:MAG: hypothetical protein GKR89_29465 [Candidatus Latescibacteria bacterium]|nr:hypothetical protein [Candidatus Latescibacterota bacterium]
MTAATYPTTAWEPIAPEQAGLNPDGIARIKTWLDERVENRKYRFALIKDGRLVADWNHDLEGSQNIGVASTWKSMLSNVLGMAVAEGKLPSA